MLKNTQSATSPEKKSVVTTPKKTTHIQILPTTLGSEEQLPRYFQRIVAQLKNSGDLWQIMTTVPNPTVFNEKLATLKQGLGMIKYKEQLMKNVFTSPQKGEEDYNTFIDGIYNALFDTNGIYYTIPHRTNLDTYTRHQAHTLIIEAETGICINNASHLKKAQDLVRRLEKFNKLLVSLVITYKDSNVEDMEYLTMYFQNYFAVQIQCIKIAIEYHVKNFNANKDKLKDPQIKASEALKEIAQKTTEPDELSDTSEIIQIWHGNIIYKRTPHKHDTPCLHTIVSNETRTKNPRTIEIINLAKNALTAKRLRDTLETPMLSTGATPLFKQLAVSSDDSTDNELSIKRRRLTAKAPLVFSTATASASVKQSEVLEIASAFEKENLQSACRKLTF